VLCDDVTIVPQRSETLGAKLQHDWWQAYAQHVRELTGPAQVTQQLLRRALARRLSLAVPPYPKEGLTQQPLATLEHQFERSVSTLLGIDSLLLAVPEPDSRDEEAPRQIADRQLPSPINALPVRFTGSAPSVTVEPIAYRVPEDCFYLRCGKLANYGWLRSFVTGWGGSLHEIVSLPVLDQPVRQRVETQLGIGLSKSQDMGMDECLEDMAIIGCDFFFREGAAVGVLLHARRSRELAAILARQRESLLQQFPQAESRRLAIDGHAVSLIATPDHRIRSFYAADHEFHLVTNCRYVMQSFLATRRGRGSLAALKEYRFARSKVGKTTPLKAFIYLSDPFFRQLASPRYRTEVTRRANSLADMRELGAARLVAHSEFGRSVDVNRLASVGYVSDDFGRHPDGSYIQWEEGQAVDSLRGCQGTFLPIPDITVDRLTPRELQSYHSFAQQYRRQWGRVDPLTVTLRSGGEVDGSEQVHMSIYVTPYARQRYAFLARHLAPATHKHVGQVPGDVMWIDAALRSNHSKTLHAHLALQDRAIKYGLEQGQLKTEESLAGRSFSTSSQYLGVTPPGVDGLKFVQQFVDDLQSPSRSAQVPRTSQSAPNPLVSFAQFFLGSRAGKILEMMFIAGTITTNDRFTVFARDEQLRTKVADQLHLQRDRPHAQISLSVVDPDQTQVADYLHAYAFSESRQASAMNAQMLNYLPQQLGLPPAQSRRLTREILGATPACPLFGEYRLTGAEPTQVWRSTAWRESSLHDVHRVPDDYRFPFLHWLQGIDIRFVLSQNTLLADVNLKVRSGGMDEAPGAATQASVINVESLQARNDFAKDDSPLASGDPAVVAAPRANLQIGSKTVQQLRRGTRLVVVDVRGDWIGVEVTTSGRTLRGWLKRSELRR
jgi:hypothetical protein